MFELAAMQNCPIGHSLQVIAVFAIIAGVTLLASVAKLSGRRGNQIQQLL